MNKKSEYAKFSPEPVDVGLGLREHDVQRGGAAAQRLLDVLRANDERARELRGAGRKRMLPVHLFGKKIYRANESKEMVNCSSRVV